MGEALNIQVRREQGYAIVAVAGEVDIATVTRLRERLSSWQPAAARWSSTWTRSASLILPGSRRWSARPGGRRARGQPAGSLRPAPDPAAVPPDRAGRPGNLPHPGRGTGVPGGGPARNLTPYRC